MKPTILVYRELWHGLCAVKARVSHGKRFFSTDYTQAYADLRNLITRIVPINIRKEKVKLDG